MKMQKRFSKKNKRAVCAILLLTAGGLVACAKKADNKTHLPYELPTETVIEAGVEYTPDFSLRDGMSARIVSITTPASSETTVSEGKSFTPDLPGEYEYIVQFTRGDEVENKAVKLTVRDTLAPEFGALSDKSAEIGFYTALGEDIESANVSDVCDKVLTVYAKEIVYNGKTTTLGKGVKSVFLPKTGEYTIVLVAEDFSGNKTEKSYKLNAKDTKKPEFDLPVALVGWVQDGKIGLNEVKIVEVGGYTVKTTATFGGTPVTVENNSIVSSELGKYELTFEATDDAGNVSTATATLYAKERGVLADFTEDKEIALWQGETVRFEDGKMYFLSENDGAELYFTEYFAKNPTGFTTLSYDLYNGRGSDLAVTAYVLAGGTWYETPTSVVGGGTVNTSNLYAFTETKKRPLFI